MRVNPVVDYMARHVDFYKSQPHVADFIIPSLLIFIADITLSKYRGEIRNESAAKFVRNTGQFCCGFVAKFGQ